MDCPNVVHPYRDPKITVKKRPFVLEMYNIDIKARLSIQSCLDDAV